jgi:hypothetical protein
MKSLFAASLFFCIFMIGSSSSVMAQGKLEIMVVPTANELNWDNPTKLTYAFLRSYARRMIAENIYKKERTAMGHGLVRTKCHTGEEEVDFWSGFNGNTNNYALNLAKAGAGLSVFLYDYNDGYIQSTEFVHKYLKDIISQPSVKPSFIRINVSQEQCRMIKQHFEDFNSQDTLWYGFFTDPHKANGAGCTSYVISYAQKAGIFPQFLEKNWTRKVSMSLKHLGPTRQNSEIDGHVLEPVSFFKFMNPLKQTKWNNKGDKLISFLYPDPQFMIDFLLKSVTCLENPAQCNDRPDLMDWLIENKAKVTTNEYMKGIEIVIE